MYETRGIPGRRRLVGKHVRKIDATEMVMTTAKEAISRERWLGGDKEYCATITLDVKIAFSSTNWDAKLAVFDSKDVPNYWGLL